MNNKNNNNIMEPQDKPEITTGDYRIFRVHDYTYNLPYIMPENPRHNPLYIEFGHKLQALYPGQPIITLASYETEYDMIILGEIAPGGNRGNNSDKNYAVNGLKAGKSAEIMRLEAKKGHKYKFFWAGKYIVWFDYNYDTMSLGFYAQHISGDSRDVNKSPRAKVATYECLSDDVVINNEGMELGLGGPHCHIHRHQRLTITQYRGKLCIVFKRTHYKKADQYIIDFFDIVSGQHVNHDWRISNSPRVTLWHSGLIIYELSGAKNEKPQTAFLDIFKGHERILLGRISAWSNSRQFFLMTDSGNNEITMAKMIIYYLGEGQ